MTLRTLPAFALAATALLGCSGGNGSPPAAVDDSVARSGGDGTTFTVGKNAFAQAAENLLGDRRDPFFDGNSLFNRNWTTAPA